MARKSKSLNDYKNLAKKYRLEFLEATSPRYVSESCRWRCLDCGRELKKCYNNVKFKRFVCPCRWQTLTPTDYQTLARTLGIDWIGEMVPLNTKSKTSWMGRSRKFKASYTELAYGIIPKRLHEFIPEIENATSTRSGY